MCHLKQNIVLIYTHQNFLIYKSNKKKAKTNFLPPYHFILKI